MTKLRIILMAAALLPSFLYSVTLKQETNAVTVSTANYTLIFKQQDGYALRIAAVGKHRLPYALGTPVVYTDNELDKYEGRYNPDPLRIDRSRMHPVLTVLSNTPEKAELAIAYAFPGGKVQERVTITESPVLHYDVTLDYTTRIYAEKFELGLTGCGTNGLFIPDNRRVTGVWHGNGALREGVCWQSIWYPEQKTAIGLAALPGNPQLRGLEYSAQGKQEGWGPESANLRAVCGSFSNLGKQGRLSFRHALLIGDSIEGIRAAAESLVGAPKAFVLYHHEIQKLVTRPGDGNTLLIEVRNNSTSATAVELRHTLFYALDSRQALPATKIALNAGESKQLRIPYVLPTELSKGYALRTDMVDATGKVVDTHTDFGTVSTFMPRDAGFGIINVAQAFQEGSEGTWNRCFKDKYVGGYEYYCWTLSTIFGLAPQVDSWLPNSENNYNSVLTKKLLKTFNADAKERGIGVYAWITGLWNYKYALQHPEWIQYCESGQPNIYSGSIRPNGDRRAVVKPHMFTEERATLWANEMADSVDMFGWSGCRWDWTFVPSAACDPLYMGRKQEEWYDHRGIPQSKLFPDPDDTGAKCLSAWRKVLEKRHPEFVFGTNYASSPEDWKRYPKYHAEAARNGLVLFEDMLNYSVEERNTFEKWGGQLAERTDLVRRVGGAPVVGSMHGLPYGNVAYDLANYTCAAAGVKWWASYETNLLIGDAYRNRFFMRFAEYYYSCDFLRPAALPLKQLDAQRVLWKPFLRERATANGREIVVPVVNLPDDSDYICQHHDIPGVRKNLHFALTPKAGERITAVWVMTPQHPEQAEKLPVSHGAFSLPELINTAVVLIQTREK